jgi:hypothetical protein
MARNAGKQAADSLRSIDCNGADNFLMNNRHTT